MYCSVQHCTPNYNEMLLAVTLRCRKVRPVGKEKLKVREFGLPIWHQEKDVSTCTIFWKQSVMYVAWGFSTNSSRRKGQKDNWFAC